MNAVRSLDSWSKTHWSYPEKKSRSDIKGYPANSSLNSSTVGGRLVSLIVTALRRCAELINLYFPCVFFTYQKPRVSVGPEASFQRSTIHSIFYDINYYPFQGLWHLEILGLPSNMFDCRNLVRRLYFTAEVSFFIEIESNCGFTIKHYFIKNILLFFRHTLSYPQLF